MNHSVHFQKIKYLHLNNLLVYEHKFIEVMCFCKYMVTNIRVYVYGTIYVFSNLIVHYNGKYLII